MKRTILSVVVVFFFAISLPYLMYYYGSYKTTVYEKRFLPIGYKVRSHNQSLEAPGNVSSTPSPTTTPPLTCDPEVNVAYIKTHKTASTTLQTIFNRFGFFKNLSFIFNKRSPANGHFNYLVINNLSARDCFLPPLHVRSGHYKKYTNYNMIAVHVRYYRKALERFMAKGTRFVTIIREPSAQWESAFNHFEFRKSILKVAGKDKILRINSTFSIPFNENTSSVHAIQEFLRKPNFYRELLKSIKYQNIKYLLWHYSRNNQIFDLGLASELHDNETQVNATIKQLSQELDFVVINEYFDESLVVMKRMLCWTFNDILYLPKNQRPLRSELTGETRARIREWNRADVLLYDRFNRTLWRKIREYGPRFNKDLRKFRRLLNETRHNCSTDEERIIKWGKSFEHKEFVPRANSSLFCQTIAESKTALFLRIFNRQKPKAPKRVRHIRKVKTKVVHLPEPLPDNPKNQKKSPTHKLETKGNEKGGPLQNHTVT